MIMIICSNFRIYISSLYRIYLVPFPWQIMILTGMKMTGISTEKIVLSELGGEGAHILRQQGYGQVTDKAKNLILAMQK